MEERTEFIKEEIEAVEEGEEIKDPENTENLENPENADEKDSSETDKSSTTIRLNPDDYEEYDGEINRSVIGMEAAFVGRKGKLLPCRISGYYFDGGWLITEAGSTISDKVSTIYVRKNREGTEAPTESKGGGS